MGLEQDMDGFRTRHGWVNNKTWMGLQQDMDGFRTRHGWV